MMKPCLLISVALLAASNHVSSFAPMPRVQRQARGMRQLPSFDAAAAQHSRLLASTSDSNKRTVEKANNGDHFQILPSTSDSNELSLEKALMLAAPAMVTMFSSLPAEAADGSFFPIASALAAYFHYFALLTCAGVLVTERFTVKPDMTLEEEERLWKVDALYGLAGVVLAVSGYYRVVEYGKGWDFYSHEPLFWLKLALVGIWGASSFFPTIIITKRAIEGRNTGTYPPMSETLANRILTVINAELLALAAIPLTATLMSRGVLYMDDFPWPVGAAFVVLTFGGFGYKYVSEALTWKEDNIIVSNEDE